MSPDALVRSGKWAFFGLFGGAAFWLVLGALFGLIASVKMHKPDLFADCAWLSYGRLKGTMNVALMFGFATQGALGIALWLISLLGRTEVRLSFLTFALSKVYNVVILIGVIGIFQGDTSGYIGFELPRYAAGLLLFAYVAISLPVLITFHNRTERNLYPSLWFVIAALFWFAWLFSVGLLLVHVYPVRGILSAAVHGWVVNGLDNVWIVPMAMAVLLYVLPTLSGKPLPSRATALAAFWMIAFFGPFGGIPVGTPLPSWVGALATGASAFIIVPVLAVYYNVAGMKTGGAATSIDRTTGKFADFSFLCLLVYGVFVMLNSFETVSRITHFTYVQPALKILVLFGVGGSAIFAAAYQVLPRLAPACETCAKVAGIHFHLFRIGVVVAVFSLAFAGLQQGQALANGELPFADSVAESKMMFRMSTLGDLVLLLSGLVFLLYVIGTTVRSLKADWQACEWCAGKPAEVAS